MIKKYYLADIAATAAILLIGAAGAVHLYGVFLHRPLEKCAIWFGAAALLTLAVSVCGAVFLCRRKGKGDSGKVPWTRWEVTLLAVFLLLLISQLVFIMAGDRAVYRDGDMTAETVGSFLENGGIYEVNPMTGNPYQAGLPNRIKILCLPTLYAMLCHITGLGPTVLVWRIIPVVTLLCSYTVYLCLGKSLFPDSRRRQLFFLAAAALLIWVGSYRDGMEGFNLMYSGWRGLTWRNAVLIPYTISLCLRKKYLHGLLCAAAEVCIVWTLYGLGMCLPVTGGMALAAFLSQRGRAGKEGR